LNDPVVAGMTAEAEGCYIRLLARSWLSETPGRVPEKLASEFGGMHRIPSKDDRPCLVWESVRAAFDVSSEKGVWIQRRMVREYERLANNYTARVAGALKTLGKRAQPSRSPSRSSSRSPGVEVEVDGEVEESKSTPSSLCSVSENGDSKKKTPKPKAVISPKESEWIGAFHEQFWTAWMRLGRQCSKADALSAWNKVPHRDPDADFNRLMDAFEAAVELWRSEKRETRHYPHAATWLNDYHRNLVLEAS